MTLESIFDHGKETAKYIFDMQGDIKPMWIVETKDGDRVPMMVEITSNKDEVAEAVKKALKKLKAVRYVSILEAWAIETKDQKIPESLLLGAPVSQHPDRREIVAIFAQDKVEGCMSGMFYILRPEIGKPRLSGFKEYPKSDKHEGRFVNLLED